MPGIYVWVKKTVSLVNSKIFLVFFKMYTVCILYKSSVFVIQNSRIVELFTVHVDLQLGILQCIKVVLNNRKYPYFTDTCIPHMPKNFIQKTFTQNGFDQLLVSYLFRLKKLFKFFLQKVIIHTEKQLPNEYL